MAASRATGSSTPTGSSANIAETRFSMVPSPWAGPAAERARTETGTRVRITRPSVDSPRERNRSRNPRVISARTTSLTVPPWAALIRLTSARSAAVQA